MRSNRSICGLVLLLSVQLAHSQSATWVHFGTNGTLVYYSDDLTNHLIDYSYAGYQGGGVALPTNEPIATNVSAITGDNTASIQNAINYVSGLATNAQGIRGVVLLSAGNYEMDGVLDIAASGVVLRGSGTNTVLNFYGTPSTSITISGASAATQVGSTYTITDAYVPLGATSFHLSSTSGLAVGSNIVVRRPWTTTWINAIGMSNYWSASGHQNDAERQITAINGTQVTVDIALPTPIEQKWVTGEVFAYTDTGRVQQCAVEDLSMVSYEGGGLDDTNFPFGATGIQLGNCKNCWVQGIACSGYGVAINTAPSACKWCTAQDCTYANGVNNGSARPSAFQIGGQMGLIQRMVGLSGFEHFLQTDDEATGPNVFLNCYTTGSDFDGGPHRYWAVSLLTDNESGTVGNVHIVVISGGDNGWGAGYSVFYNCDVNNFTIQEPGVDHTYNWWIGGSGVNTDPATDAGIYDTEDVTVTPNSLYLEQLKERLGGAAVEKIGYPLFSISAQPATQFVLPGSNAAYTVTLGDPTLMSNTVALSLAGLPPGIRGSLSTNTLIGAASATLSITASNSAVVGTYPLNVIGASAGLTHTAAVTLVVGTFSVSANPAAQVVLQGHATNFSVSIATNTGFAGSVSLGLGGLPVGATSSFAPPSLSGAGTSVLNVTTATNTPHGNYVLTLLGTNGSTVTTATAALLVTISNTAAASGTLVWNATNNVSSDTNWSSGYNWTNLSVGGTGFPTVSNQVIFTDAGAVGSAGLVNNLVDSSFPGIIASLQYSNTSGYYHTTEIPPGQTLSIIGPGGLTDGSTNADFGLTTTNWATIAGPGVLSVSNAAAVIYVGLGDASSGTTARGNLDLSGLGTFSAYVSQLQVGIPGVNRPSGVLYLALTNQITVLYSTSSTETSDAPGTAAMGIGEANGNTGLPSALYLGLTNSIYADTIVTARQKASGAMQFNPAIADSNPSAYFRGHDGISPVLVWSIADGVANSGTTQPRGTNDFTGGTVDALVDTMYIGRAASAGSATNGAVGILTMGAGNISVSSLYAGYQPAANGNYGVGIINFNGSGKLSVSGTLGLGLSSGGTGAASTAGALNVSGGTVAAGSIVVGAGPSNTISLSSGALLLTNSAGPGIAALSLTNSALHFNLNGAAAVTNLVVSNLSAVGLNTIWVDSVTNVSASNTFHLIGYATLAGAVPANLSLAALPNGYRGSLLENTAAQTIDLSILPGGSGSPRFTAANLSGNSLVMKGTNGLGNGIYYVIASTNLARPLSQWTRVATNFFGTTGSFQFSNTFSVPGQFYALQVPE
jgi:hypothetical protein